MRNNFENSNLKLPNIFMLNKEDLADNCSKFEKEKFQKEKQELLSKSKELENQYADESWQTILKKLAPNYYYIFLDKAFLPQDPNKPVYPGHICCFFTDSDRKIIDKTFISLRPGRILFDKKLFYTFAHTSDQSLRTNPIWTVKFVNAEEEFKKYFLKKNPSDHTIKRFLIGVRQDSVTSNIEELLQHIQQVKEDLSQKEYILADEVVKTYKSGRRDSLQIGTSLNLKHLAI